MAMFAGSCKAKSWKHSVKRSDAPNRLAGVVVSAQKRRGWKPRPLIAREDFPQMGNASILDDRRKGTVEAQLRMLERQKGLNKKRDLPSFKAVREGLRGR